MIGLWVPSAFANSCQAPSKQELMNLFGAVRNWTSVKNKAQTNSDNPVMATENVIKIRVDFNNPTRSLVQVGNQRFNNLSAVCKDGRAVKIYANHPDFGDVVITLKKEGDGIVSHINPVGSILGLTFYYMPSEMVVSDSQDLEEMYEDAGYETVTSA